MARGYNQKQRAAAQDETRRRIVDSAIELHQTLGPAATTLTEIARRAGVGRVTVYRHFPDEDSLAQACSGQYFALHPAPDPVVWQAIADPVDRLHAALTDSYRYHRSTEPMIGRVLVSSRDHPVMAPYFAHWARAADIVTAPFRLRGGRRTLLRAAVGLAISFDTWRCLAIDQGLTDVQAVQVASRFVDVR